MEHNDPLIDFIRNTLGCACPDEVFDKIEISTTDDLTRIVVGDRLLIHLPRPGFEPADVAGLLQQGKNDRNRHGHNRFRLVLPCSDHSDEQSETFEQARASDSKLHLHFVATEEHARVLRLCRSRTQG